jgi:long-chain acyl-CoA synthetase
MEIRTPWLKHYGDIPAHLEYPNCMMSELVLQTAEKYPNIPVYDFFGVQATYHTFAEQIHECARALAAVGIVPDDVVTICMPNMPQAIIMFYALNYIGAVANMVHPLSAEEEIAFYINSSKSKAVLTLDQFYPKFQAIEKKIDIAMLILTSPDDSLKGITKLGYKVTQGRKIKKAPTGGLILRWTDLLKKSQNYSGTYYSHRNRDDTAAILYSGGTTGTTKGILLTNLNFNALALQTAAAGDCITVGHKMLSIMPIFHGFGLGVCIHTMLVTGVTCILVPQFTVQTYADLLRRYRPNYIAGVPTLYEALLRMENIDKLDLSQLEGMFSGGDSLSIELKRKVDKFLKDHGAAVQVREGYGTTECVTASCLTPKNFHKEGSIGIPFPDTYYKIVTPSTQDEVPYGQIGEICISGPTVMKGYENNPKETAQALQLHPDGRVWLHTGDLGSMDTDGFIYFKQRLKRMIISSGYNIYPSQLENIIDAHPDVLMSTVIGVKDDYKMQKVKAFVVLKEGIDATDAVKASIEEHCRRNIAKYAMPYAFEYRDSLPKTLVGKVAYTVLEREEEEKQNH